MISIQEYLTESEFNYIVIEFNQKDFRNLDLDIIEEGIWVDSYKKGWSQRVDPVNPGMNIKRHVHVARTKHISNKNQQVAWNDDRSRHDKKTFNQNLSGLETAKNIARDALGLDHNVILEGLSKAGPLILLTESQSDLSSSSPFEPIYLSGKL